MILKVHLSVVQAFVFVVCSKSSEIVQPEKSEANKKDLNTILFWDAAIFSKIIVHIIKYIFHSKNDVELISGIHAKCKPITDKGITE